MAAQELEESVNLAQYWDILKRRRWWLLITLFVVWSLAFAATWVLPAKYHSEATILIEEPRVPEHYVQPNISSDPQDRFQTLSQQILSRTRLQQIVEDLNLYAAERRRVTIDDVIDRMRRDIKIDPVMSSGRPPELTAFTVSYTGSSPTVAQQVTTRLTSLFIEENLRTREQQSEQTTNFLENQVQDARARLEQQEKALKEFKSQYLGQLPSQVDTNLSILTGLDSRLQNANEALNRAEQQKLYLKSLLAQYRDMRSAASTTSNPPLATQSPLDSELSRMKVQLADLQTRYTDQHPDLVHLRDQIARTEKLKAEIEKEPAPGKPDDAAAAESSTTAQLQSQLDATELEVANRKKEMAKIETEVQEVQGRLKATPIREQQLADLSRDYDQSRTYYESLLAKREQSQLATDLEKREQGEQFHVLDPPNLPNNPDFPNRFKFSLAGLALGVIAGAAAGYGRELVDDRIHGRVDVEKLSKSTILVVIPPATTRLRSVMRRFRLCVELACGTVLLGVVTAGTLMAYIAYRS